MQANKTVSINGRRYDAVTGLPVSDKPTASAEGKSDAKPAPKRTNTVSAGSVHSTQQRSQTLNRRTIKKPAPPKRPQPGRHMDITPSAHFKHFASHPVAPAKRPSTPDIAPKNHPAASRAEARIALRANAVTATSKQVKEAAISAALAKPAPKEPKERRWRWSRRSTIITACFAVLIFGAFLTYMNIPSLSVGFAAAQAGINASYPEYKPDGYTLQQPVTYSDGQVTLVFGSTSGAGEYTIVQSRSSWDSSAVLDNVVKEAAGDNYVTTQERGLTIYSYEGHAVWVNGGILYTITTTAPLSGEQIRHIATSL